MSANDNKKYYWLKLQNDFFKRHDIEIVENMPNGKDYIIFYLKLLCESTSHEGKLRFSEEIPYNDEMLSTITNTNIDIVRNAIKILCQLKMIEILDDGTLYMKQVEKMLGIETGKAKRMREYRSNLLTGSNEPKCSLDIDIDIELDKDIDIDKNNNTKHKYGSYKNVLLNDNDYSKLKNEFPNNYEEWIEKADSYVQSTGKKYKDYLATIRNWAKKEKKVDVHYDSSKNEKLDVDRFNEIMKKRKD